MNKRAWVIASGIITFALVSAARSEDLVYQLRLQNGMPEPIRFVVDGKYVCDAQSARSASEGFTCILRSECMSYKIQDDENCVPSDLDAGPHTVVVTWSGQQFSKQIKLKYYSGDEEGPDGYFMSCSFYVPDGETAPILYC